MEITTMKYVLSLLLAAALTGCFQSVSPDEYIRLAQAELKENKYKEAIINLKNALKEDLSNEEARFLLGKAYMIKADGDAALKELLRAKELGKNAELVNVELSKAYYLTGDAEAIIGLINERLDYSEPSLITLNSNAGLVSLQNGDRKNAEIYINTALMLSKDSSYSLLGSAWLKSSKSDYDEALKVVEKILEVDSEFFEALILKGHIKYLQKSYSESSKIFNDYVQANPQRHDVTLYLINSLLASKQFDEAIIHIEKLLKINSNNGLINQQMAQAMFYKQDFELALEHSNKALQSNKGLLVANIIGGISAFHLGNLEQSYQLLKPVESRLSAESTAKKLLAVVQLNLGYENDATKTFSAIESMAENDINFFKIASSELLRIDEKEEAISNLDKIIAKNPKNTELLSHRGALRLLTGDESGIADIEAAIKSDKSLYGSKVALILQYAALENEDKARGLLEELEREQVPTSESVINIVKGLVSVKFGDLKQASTAFDAVLKVNPNHTLSLLNKALIAEKELNYIGALTYLESLIGASPNHELGLKNYTRVCSLAGGNSRAVKFLKNISTNNAEAGVRLYMSLAYMQVMHRDYSSALSSLKKIEDSKELPNSYYIAKADVYQLLNDKEGAIKGYKLFLKEEPTSLIGWTRLAGTYESEKRQAEALKTVNLAIEELPDSLSLKFIRISYLIGLDSLVEARDALGALDASESSLNQSLELSGKLALKQHDYRLAEKNFRTLFSRNNSQINAVLLAQALIKADNSKEAETHLLSYLKGEPTALKARNVLAEIYLVDRPEKAVEHYAIMANSHPSNFIILNNLAWNQYKSGELKSAEENIKRAIELAPENSSVLDSYGYILAAIGEVSESILKFELSIKMGNNSVATRLKLAELYLSKQQSNQARELIKGVSAVNQENVDKLKLIKKELEKM